MAFTASQLYQAYAQRIRLPWNTNKGRAVLQSFFKVLGDLTIDWGTQANLEHLPEYASAASVALTANERQIDAGPTETSSALATRITGAVQSWQRAGTTVGVLTALYWAGFPNAVIVQQNGLAFSFSAPLTPGVDPLLSLVITPCSQTDVPLHSDVTLNRSIPTSTSWWTFDSNTDFCSRFAVLFPGILPTSFQTKVSATFDGTQDFVDVIWPNVFPDATYSTGFSVTTTDGSSPLVYLPAANVTQAGVRVGTSARFSGQVDLVAYQLGGNPFADPHPADLGRLRSVISKWRPAKAFCVGVYALVAGNFIGWPVRTIGSATPGPSTVVAFTGGF